MGNHFEIIMYPIMFTPFWDSRFSQWWRFKLWSSQLRCCVVMW